MRPEAKKILNNLLTAMLALGTLFGTYLFSVAATVGLILTVFPDSIGTLNFKTSAIVTLTFLISISLIVLIPLARIIWQSPGKRWATTRSVSLLLWPYLVFSLLVFYFSILITTGLNWFAVVGPNLQPHLLLSGITVSAGLAGSYYWYVKRIKKTLLLK